MTDFALWLIAPPLPPHTHTHTHTLQVLMDLCCILKDTVIKHFGMLNEIYDSWLYKYENKFVN